MGLKTRCSRSQTVDGLVGGVGQKNKLEICYYNIRKACVDQCRTYI